MKFLTGAFVVRTLVAATITFVAFEFLRQTNAQAKIIQFLDVTKDPVQDRRSIEPSLAVRAPRDSSTLTTASDNVNLLSLGG